jgi:hypothetical protein
MKLHPALNLPPRPAPRPPAPSAAFEAKLTRERAEDTARAPTQRPTPPSLDPAAIARSQELARRVVAPPRTARALGDTDSPTATGPGMVSRTPQTFRVGDLFRGLVR